MKKLSMPVQVRRLFPVLISLLLSQGPLVAQIGTPGAFVGTVRDSSGAVLPGAAVSATNISTGVTQQVTTDAAGRYRIAQLPPASYRVEASLQGFRPEERTNVELTVSRTQELDFTLAVGPVTATVEVTSEAALVDTSASSVSALVNGSAVRDLPLNGRSFDQLITLTPGTAAFTGWTSSAVRGTSTLFVAGGNRPSTTKLIVDGSELAGGGDINTIVSTSSGKMLGVEAIQEFAVITNNGDATYGKKPGGQVNIVTRSGTNEFHGSVFEFVRNDIFDARSFFAPEKDPLRQNNYGFAVGGPILKNKMFFFTNLEMYKQRQGVALVAPVPTLAVRRGIFPNGTAVPVNPNIQPILALYPLPNGRDFGDGTAQANTLGSQTIDDNYVVGRVDYYLSATQSLFGRYLIQTGRRSVPDDNGLGLFPEQNPFRTQLFTLGYKKIFSPQLLNQFTSSLNRSHLSIAYVPRSGLTIPQQMILIPGATQQGGIGVGSVSGGSGIGILPVLGGSVTVGSPNRFWTRTVFEFSDQLSYSTGAHYLQWGAQVQRIRADEYEGTHSLGYLQFPTLLAFIQGIPNQFNGPTPGSDALRNYRQTYTAFYMQDGYKIKPNLTLNLGLRWEFLNNPIDTKGRTSAFVPAGDQLNGIYPNAPTITSHAFAENHSGNFAPRVGFAWNVFGKGRTSVRGGFGLFYGQIENEYRRTLGASAPFYNEVTVTNPPFPNPGQSLGNAALAKLAPLGIQQAPDIPTNIQYNLTIEQQLAPDTVLRAAYVGSHSYHLARDGNAQIPPPVLNADGRLQIAQSPQNPNLSPSAHYIVFDAVSFYNSLQMELEKRLSHGLRVKAAFTWSKTMDEAVEPVSGTNGVAQAAAVMTNHRFDRGPAAYNVGRRLAFNWSYDLPIKTQQKAAGVLLNGWQLAGIFQVQDGLPFSVFDGIARSFTPSNASQATDRPDLNPGHTGPVILGGPDRYFDPTAFLLQPAGVLGNVGSATQTGPGMFTVDASLMKNFRISERLQLQFRADAFNLFNRPNFGLPNNNLFVAGGARIGSAGLIGTTVTDSRELQFALKLIF